MNPLRLLGQAKYKVIRVVAYVQFVNLAILIQLNGFHVWYLLLIPAFILAYYFESKFGIPGELDVAWKSSKVWTDYEAKFDKLRADFYELRDRLIKL